MFEENQADSIAKSLKVLALSKLAEELYPKDQREEFFHKITEQRRLGDEARTKAIDPGTPKEEVRDFLEIAKRHDKSVTELERETPILGALAILARSYK